MIALEVTSPRRGAGLPRAAATWYFESANLDETLGRPVSLHLSKPSLCLRHHRWDIERHHTLSSRPTEPGPVCSSPTTCRSSGQLIINWNDRWDRTPARRTPPRQAPRSASTEPRSGPR